MMAIGLMSSSLFAQHNDVEFGYDDLSSPTSFILSPLGFEATTDDGILLIKSNMRELDPFTPGDFGADQPGFTTHANGNPPLLVNPFDSIWIRALDASVYSDFGVGYVNYYDPLTDELEAEGRILFDDNSIMLTDDLILNGDSIESGDNPQFIRVADDAGTVHDHITWDLLDDATAPEGAYGIMVQLQSDFATTDGNMDLSSDPFWLVFNHGMSDEDFNNFALPRYGVGAVPEPSGIVILGLAGCVCAFRRRRRI